MSTLSNLNSYKRTMNGIQSFDDGMGGTMENGAIVCNSFTTDSFTATNINATTGNITTLNSTTGNIETLNTDTITNSGSITTTFLNMKNGGFVYNGDTSTYSEQYINTNTNIYIYTLYPPINKAVWIINGNNTLTLDDTKITVPQIDSILGNITTINVSTINASNVNSNNGAITTLNTSTINASIGTIQTMNTLTLNASTATIDSLNITNFSPTNINCSNLNCSTIQPVNNANTFNLLTNNTGGINIGKSGALKLYSSQTNLCVNSANNNYTVNTGTNTTGSYSYIDFKSSNSTNGYDSHIVSTGGVAGTNGKGTLMLEADTISNNFTTYNLNGYRFRFVPWTSFFYMNYASTSSLSGIINYPTGANCPSTPSGTQVRYNYNIIGNSMYVNFHLNQPSAGLMGSGTYQYIMPHLSSLYSLDTTFLIQSGTTTPTGTRLGQGNIKVVGTTSTVTVGVYWISQGGNWGLMLFEEGGSNIFNYVPNAQSSGRYSYQTNGSFVVNFEAILPIQI